MRCWIVLVVLLLVPLFLAGPAAAFRYEVDKEADVGASWPLLLTGTVEGEEVHIVVFGNGLQVWEETETLALNVTSHLFLPAAKAEGRYVLELSTYDAARNATYYQTTIVQTRCGGTCVSGSVYGLIAYETALTEAVQTRNLAILLAVLVPFLAMGMALRLQENALLKRERVELSVLDKLRLGGLRSFLQPADHSDNLGERRVADRARIDFMENFHVLTRPGNRTWGKILTAVLTVTHTCPACKGTTKRYLDQVEAVAWKYSRAIRVLRRLAPVPPFGPDGTPKLPDRDRHIERAVVAPTRVTAHSPGIPVGTLPGAELESVPPALPAKVEPMAKVLHDNGRKRKPNENRKGGK